MEQPRITFVINGRTFSLSAGDDESIGALPAAERRQLIDLLEAVQRADYRAREVAQRALDRASLATADAAGAAAQDAHPAPGERLGKGDVDALMARLVAEDNRNRKSGPTQRGLYKWVLGIAVACILLAMIL